MIENGLKTMKQFFDGSKKFKVPEYQRAFAWEKKQLEEFFYDIFYQTSKQKYYYGTILLNEKEDENDFDVYEVVDGQQRITTLIIFVYLLLQRIKNLDETQKTKLKSEIFIKYHDIYKLELNNFDNSFFQTYIISKRTEKPVVNTPSQRRLLFAKTLFQKLFEVEKIELPKCLDMLKVVEKAELLIYSVNNSAEATLIFETTNDRGKRLTNLEKMKSFMMYKCFLANQSGLDETIKRLYDRFGKIYQIIESLIPLFEKLKINIADEDKVCQYHFIGYFDWKIKKDYQNYLDEIKGHINNLLNKNKPKTAVKFIEDYSSSLHEFYDNFKNMLLQNDANLKDVFYLERVAVFYPLLIKAYKFDTTPNKNEFSSLTKIASTFSFRVLGLKFKRTNDVDVFLNTETKNFLGEFKNLRLSLKDKIDESAPLKRMKERIGSELFYDEYNSIIRNYLLWRYENYLRKQNPKMTPMPIEDLITEDTELIPTTEHINSIASEWDERVSQKEIVEFEEKYLNCIGNLVLDPKSSNSSKGKKKWKIKQDEYYSQTPLKSQLELRTFLDKTKKTWGKNSVTRRKEKLIKFLEEPGEFI